MKTVRVELGRRSYDIRVGRGLLKTLGRNARAMCPSAAGGGTVAVIADSRVARLYGQQAVQSVEAAGYRTRLISFPAGEPHKNLQTYGRLMDHLLRLKPPIDRSSLIVALGGGVTGDLAGFVAATALRGINFLQCPTTLLAAVDASVGGKTAVDMPAGKNLVGAFHQPCGVLIDVALLKTLPRTQLVNGLAECVKHAVIRDEKLLAFLETRAADILACREAVMERLVTWNVAIKAAVVSADEREAGERAHLNFGHTIGHAMETLLGYDRIGHGQAVSLGMVAASRLACGRGMISREDCLRVETLLRRLGLPVRLPRLSAARIWSLMQHDKKNRLGRVRMVLPTALGRVEILDDIRPEEVAQALSENHE